MTPYHWYILALATCLIAALALVTVAATLATGELIARGLDIYYGARIESQEENERLRLASDRDLADFEALKREYDKVTGKNMELQREVARLMDDNRNLRNRVSGQSLAEYGVTLVLIVIVAIGLVALIGTFAPEAFDFMAKGLHP